MVRSRRRSKSRGTLVVLVFQGILSLVCLWLGGLGWFALTLPQPAPVPAEQHFDAIIALTGDDGRLARAGALLQAGNADRLLISGVNATVSDQAVMDRLAVPPRLKQCCIDLGREALDTRGNAAEAAAWAAEQGADRLALVTSDYHMTRSLLEFRRALPGSEITPVPVAARASAGSLAWEYSKYLLAQLRLSMGL